MGDYGHRLEFGAFLTPTASDPDLVVVMAQRCERLGYDLVTFQDHPYQPAHLDAWTLLTYVAARTSKIRVAPNVLNLPMRQPVVVARSAASLDLLSEGRVELALGAGAFWEAIEAAGGRRLTSGQSVDALEEAIQVIREVWAVDKPGGVRVDGAYYRVVGAKRGPAPAHDMSIWIGAHKPRMLALVGRSADGWLPSLMYVRGGASDLAPMNEQIDDAALEAGRKPADVRRLLNISGTFAPTSRGSLDGPPDQWAEELAGFSLDYGFSTFILASDDPSVLERFAAEVAPAVRELVGAERIGGVAAKTEADRIALAPQQNLGFRSLATADDGVRLTSSPVWDESSRPVAPAPPADAVYADQAQAVGNHLVEVHDYLRGELDTVRGLIEQVKAGTLEAGQARSQINEMTMRQNDWTLGAYCASYCRVVTAHHGNEDSYVFPHLRRADSELAPVLDRLQEEHVVIHGVLDRVDQALVDFIGRPDDFTVLQAAIDTLTDALLSHLAYEEQQLVEPLSRFGFFAGQLR